MIASLVANFRIFLLVFARVVALVQAAPLVSSQAIPQTAKLGLSLFISVAVLPWVGARGYAVPESAGLYFLLVLGEVAIGLILAFFLNIVFAVFQVAGQFFSLQMGFGASEVFDPLAQIEVPLMGQFLNLVGMFTFLTIGGAQKLVLVGVYRSFQALRAVDLVAGRTALAPLLIRSLGQLFMQALTISFPILGTLLLVYVTMGLLAKAAPQMNLLLMGFPIAIATAFLLLILVMPLMVGAFSRLIDGGFENVANLIQALRNQSLQTQGLPVQGATP
ncbi:MAG: flagellar biosynthetic protein FliR [Spirochaetales bacterium]|nr:flagellar biosynthetic protein FliR [Spirochaetales bacterium]